MTTMAVGQPLMEADKGNEGNNDKKREEKNNKMRFHEGKQNKKGPNKNKPNQVWNKVGIITTN
ncbi:hypothetical protein RDI58_015068 [Solanum bulbocastanum]|uniref:Uncharacterized protein n=1 Tax=Solanum bulbocastanum TaxID=147425 RepID=A0AAN8TDK8_SOLBU